MKMLFSLVIESVSSVFEQGLAEAIDAAKRGAQVVGDRVAEGIEFLVGGFQLAGTKKSLLFGQLAFRYVAQDSRKKHPTAPFPAPQPKFHRTFLALPPPPPQFT